ncbi:MAG: ATP-binding cassette domain-containing protein [Tissierellia bacterium]|nr:ATP-binding cassette domain-containing protein [Tissierellia bacterium]
MTTPIIQVKDLAKHFKVGGGSLKAVDGISFEINEGETFGLVGESGCGKSTAGRTMLRLYEPTGGQMIYKGEDIFSYNRAQMKEIRKDMQMIFQDPYASLDPRMTVEEIVSEPLDIYNIGTKKERKERILDLLELVGMGEEHVQRFPHEFSGGQRQRIGIARALAVRPKFIICDEPISALDVSIQAQVINLLKDLQKKLNLTLLFIAHDLSMVRYISDSVGVMYLGKLVEISKSEELYDHPLHPYTKALLSAIPIPDPEIQRSRKVIELEGDVPSPIDPKPGCRFVDRCPYGDDACRQKDPKLEEVRPGHFVACFKLKEVNGL